MSATRTAGRYRAFPHRLHIFVHVSILVEFQRYACRLTNTEVDAKRDRHEQYSRIAWLRERLLAGETLTAQTRPQPERIGARGQAPASRL